MVRQSVIYNKVSQKLIDKSGQCRDHCHIAIDGGGGGVGC